MSKFSKTQKRNVYRNLIHNGMGIKEWNTKIDLLKS